MKKWYVPLLCGFFFSPASAGTEYILTLLNGDRDAMLTRVFSSFSDCRQARTALLSALGTRDETYYVLCVPSHSHGPEKI